VSALAAAKGPGTPGNDEEIACNAKQHLRMSNINKKIVSCRDRVRLRLLHSRVQRNDMSGCVLDSSHLHKSTDDNAARQRMGEKLHD
jgi:hypothetical protein